MGTHARPGPTLASAFPARQACGSFPGRPVTHHTSTQQVSMRFPHSARVCGLPTVLQAMTGNPEAQVQSCRRGMSVPGGGTQGDPQQVRPDCPIPSRRGQRRLQAGRTEQGGCHPQGRWARRGGPRRRPRVTRSSWEMGRPTHGPSGWGSELPRGRCGRAPALGSPGLSAVTAVLGSAPGPAVPAGHWREGIGAQTSPWSNGGALSPQVPAPS